MVSWRKKPAEIQVMNGAGEPNFLSADYLILLDETRDAIDELLLGLSLWLE